ncbi:MAG: HPr(Ser) kinase/phosphatase [Clostridiales bacterium]|nr:HPr(Ser) kinase/phosphatase [Clostridiales bacterium]
MSQKFSVKLTEMIDRMNLEILYCPEKELLIETSDVNRPGLEITGYFEFFDNSRIQLFGMVENIFLYGVSSENRKKIFEKLFSTKIPCAIFARSIDVFPEVFLVAEKYEIPLLRTSIPTCKFMSDLIIYLNTELVPKIRRHGVLVEICGEGILIMGESGIGKTETAVELIKRGHRLIADDAVDLKKVSATTIVGASPDSLKHFIELRGIGIVNIEKVFGVGSTKDSEKIDMVIQLEYWKEGNAYERLGIVTEYTEILGVKIPMLKIPVSPGRNLAVIFEIAAMNNKLRRMGYNSAEMLSERFVEKDSR